MKNQELRSALIKSGTILILCVFFIYAFAAGESGGVLGTINSLLTGVVFLFGIVLAIIVSIAVMFGIYFGILYMHDSHVCKKTYGEFKTKLADFPTIINCSCPASCSTPEQSVISLSVEDLAPLHNNHNKIENNLSSLQNSVVSLEKALNSFSVSITTLDGKLSNTEEELANKATTAAVDEASQKFSTVIADLQKTVKPLADKIEKLEKTLSSLNSAETDSDDNLQEKMDDAISSIKDELVAMKSSIENIANAPAATPVSDTDPSNHRILSYFTQKADEKKFIQLVTDAVDKGMTYAQIGDFLNDSLSAEACEVIADHPSLTKDYIRTCRQNS